MTLVDTDVLIDELRQVPLAGQVLRAAAQQGKLAVSMFTRLELLVGCRDLASKQRVERLLRGFELLPVTVEISLLSKNQRDFRFIPGLKLLPYLAAPTT